MATTGSTNSNASQDWQMEKERRALPADERDAAASLGVGFDGRFYRYRAFRYDLCSDAVRYAKLDRDKPQYRGKVIRAVPWEKPIEPTDEEQRLMQELKITFDGRYYRYESYRYENCADAANYARLRYRESGR
ncbi:MAG TPA: hypothetical protein VEC01_08315 [Noviherbaspirillum sp.]|uniref:hypothetical protein n=1 Tax=Noviherbaspirillum sp. TaxID=1926288 RepID=UPI002D27CCF6|nr:hypothetical protein [Noviherbaspirillum sp.]HYD95315.1 hypothetical protein [Noviherbaspirillum sp.]